MTAVRIPDFDLWHGGYAGAIVSVYVAGTTTLATLYTSPAQTTTLPNPQTLASRQDANGELYGKWVQPVYVAVAYTLSIDTGEQTGQETPPITSLIGVDVSYATVAGTRGQDPHDLRDVIDWIIWAHSYGDMGDDVGSATTTATLQLAIGAAAAQGGGIVRIPAGNFPFSSLTLPEGVILQGEGQSATTLRSVVTTTVITLGGDGSGLIDLTLDGVNANVGSIGVRAVNIVAPRFENCVIRRFATGLQFLGGESACWRRFYISECVNGADLRGDLDTSSSGLGAPFRNIEWNCGAIAFNTTYGLRLRAVDALVENIRLTNVEIEGNLADGIILEGARDVRLEGCFWGDGLRGLHVKDNTTTPLPAINTAQRVRVLGGYFDGTGAGMEIKFEGGCEAVAFERTRFANVSFNLVSPTNTIHLLDTTQDALTSSTGLTTFLLYRDMDRGGRIVGLTSGAVSTAAWREEVPPGATWLVTAKVVARQRNGLGRGRYWVAAGVDRPGGTLNYINLTGTFTLGAIITASISGASARILADAAGVLTLSDISGTFQNGETITDGTATATVNGTLSTANAALDAGGSVAVIAAVESFTGVPTVAVTVTGASAEVTVTGVAALDIEWTVDIDVLKT